MRARPVSWARGRSKKYPYYRCRRATCKVNISKDALEQKFVDFLQGLQPRREYLRLFEAVILDVWKEQRSEIINSSKHLQVQSTRIAEKLNRLNDAFLYEQKIDREVYQHQLARLREEQVLIEMELNDMKVEELDVETVVNFAFETIRDASQFWIQGSLEQKRRFQQLIFPEGLVFDGKEFGTTTTCLAFSYLQEISKVGSSLASRTESNPCRRREREATYCNSKELRGMDSTLPD